MQEDMAALDAAFCGMKVRAGSFGRVVFPENKPKVVYKYTMTTHAGAEKDAFDALQGCKRVVPLLEPPLTLLMSDKCLDMTRFTLMRAQTDVLAATRCQLLTPRQKEALYPQLFEAVAELHKHRVAHLDLKLENLLLTDASSVVPRLWVTDFGLSFVNVEPDATYAGWVRGSKAYACPEMLSQEEPWNPYAADVYSTGVVVYALAFGAFPFHMAHRSNPMFVKYCALQEKQMCPTDALSNLWPQLRVQILGASADVKQRLDECLCKDPAKRRRFF